MKIGDHGQITIPEEFQEKFGFYPNTEIEILSSLSGIFIKRKKQTLHPVEKVFGILNKGSSTDEIISELRDE